MNSLKVDEAVLDAVALPAAEVMDAIWLLAWLAALDMALLRLDATDSTAELAALGSTIVVAGVLEDAALGSTIVVTGAALEGAALVSGISMGAPASAQTFSTASMVVFWSSAEHAPWTHGWTLDSSLAPCLQWQAKSVRVLQPSLVKGPTKQVT